MSTFTMQLSSIRGRLAPSPTGAMHLGNAFSFLMAFCSCKSKGGSLVLRIEDIDQNRSRPCFESQISKDLEWLGIEYEESPVQGGRYAPYRQSERLEKYKLSLQKLETLNVLYPCFCSRNELKMLASAPHIDDKNPIYPGTCRQLSTKDILTHTAKGKKFSVRLNVEKATFVSGYTGDTVLCGDFPLVRSDGVYSYQLAVVVDDIHMKVNEVVRGHDLEDSTPRQKLMFHLFDSPAPLFYHVPLLCTHEGDRLAKRHNSLSLAYLKEQGASSEKIIGYLGFLAGLQTEPTAISALELATRWNVSCTSRERILLPQDILQHLL